MAGNIVQRLAEDRAVTDLLVRAQSGPATLLVEGEAGIGKTTLMLDAQSQAERLGFRVLSARGSAAEVFYAYAAVADLLTDIDAAVVAELPAVQQLALNRARTGEAGSSGPATDERTLATAFLSVVERIGAQSPVLLAVDDAQWLDASSRAVIGFCARRLRGSVGMMLSFRTEEPGAARSNSWLDFRSPETTTRVCLRPFSLGGVHAVVAARLGRTLPRPVITRIYEMSGGNPLFAIELAASTFADPTSSAPGMPSSLAAMVRRRIGDVGEDVGQVLLAAATAAEPTVELVSRAAGMSPLQVMQLLETVESRGVITLDGHALRFTHPLFAAGAYATAGPARRRAMHRTLASLVEQPELRARHLALAAVTGDPATLSALDAAAEASVSRGAPAAAAELLELALKLGGDTPPRRIRAAEHHFRSGDLDAARALLEPTIDSLPRGAMRCLALMLLGAVQGYGDDTVGAVQTLTQAADEAEDGTELRLHCLLRVVLATVMIGRVGRAVDHARTAVALADRLDVPDLRSRALSIWVSAAFVYGLGVDEPALRTALELEDPAAGATTWYQASAVRAIVSAWTGDLAEARDQMSAVCRRMLNGGTEIDIIWAFNHLATIDVWLGRYADAAEASREAVERAEQTGGRHLLVTAWGWRAAVAAYRGLEDEARTAAGAAVAAANEIGAIYLADAPSATLAFVEVSLGRYDQAMTVLEPLLATFDPAHDTEIMQGGYLPDAIEALAGLGRVDEAEQLSNALAENGTRLNRRWMLAMAARGRALCLAARGNLAAAEEAAVAAIAHHQLLAMPFETARSRLLLGQVQRRRRRRQDASASLRAALQTFEQLGTPWWASRARSELARLSSTSGGSDGLTPAERRVAELAATGRSNKEIAAELFISDKTVEMALSRVYRKLGIRSRGGLSMALRSGDI